MSETTPAAKLKLDLNTFFHLEKKSLFSAAAGQSERGRTMCKRRMKVNCLLLITTGGKSVVHFVSLVVVLYTTIGNNGEGKLLRHCVSKRGLNEP